VSAPLFRLAPLPPGGRLVLEGDEGRHAASARRLQPGELVEVTDGAGLVASCRVVTAGAGRVELDVASRRVEAAPQPRLVVVQALVKGERSELAVELCTEVGVDEVVPWAAQRSIARWAGERSQRRWTAVAEAAARQSRRSRWPVVPDAHDLAAVCRRIAAADLALLLSEEAVEALGAIAVPTAGEVVLVVGPEGGFASSEHAALLAAGARPVRLGPSVLRASSAGAVAAGVLLARSSRWAAPGLSPSAARGGMTADSGQVPA